MLRVSSVFDAIYFQMPLRDLRSSCVSRVPWWAEAHAVGGDIFMDVGTWDIWDNSRAARMDFDPGA